MKKSKFLILPLLGLFLMSCSKSSMAGDYVFQMGKDKGTHFGIYLQLTDDIVTNETTEEILGKKFKLNFALQGMSQDEDVEDESELEEAKNMQRGIARAVTPSIDPTQTDNDFSLEGYYVHNPELKKKDSEGNEIVDIGITHIVFESDEGIDIPLEIDSYLIEKILYSTISGSTFTLVLPVSFEDILLQLYWYGVDILGSDTPAAHAVGTTPTQEDIDAINQVYPASHGGEKFRQIHRLHMGLAKK